MKILNFGSCNIDYIYRVHEFAKEKETINSLGLNIFPGGKGLNQSLAIAKSGTKVYHAGLIGKDGLFLRDLLRENGIDVNYLKVIDKPSGHAIIQVDDRGENSIILYEGSNYEINKDYVDEVMVNFSENDIIVLQNEISNLDYIIELANRKKMKVFLNPSPINNVILNLNFNDIDVLILNEVEAYKISKENVITNIHEFFKNNYPNLEVILTLGSKGSVYFKNEIIITCPANKVKAIDTVGAGDTFTGYFISKYLKNNDVVSSLKYASIAASLSTLKEGAASSIPNKEEVLKIVKKM